MAIRLKQSTASQEIPLGYFVDSTDGNTEETGLTIANTDIKLWKMGATSLANKNSGGATHISNGVYYCVLDATDTDTLGALIVFVHVSGALTVRVECEVLPANVYDSLIAGSDKLETDAVQFGGSNGTFASGRPEVNTSHLAGSAVDQSGGLINANIKQISGDATAADNLEAYTDGTTPMPVNATQLSGDSGAADNAEAFFDGTGYAGTNNVIPTVTNLTNAPTNGDLTATMKASVETAADNAITGNGFLDASFTNVNAALKGLTLVTNTIGATGNDTTHIHLAGLSYGDDEINNHLLVIYDASENEYHSRWITDYVGATDLATVATLPFTPQNSTDVFRLTSIRQDVTGGSGLDAAGVRSALGMASANLDTQLGDLPTAAENRAEMDSNSTKLASILEDTGTTLDDLIDTEISTLTNMLTGIVPVNGTIGATGNDTTHLHLSGLAYADDGPNSMLILVQDVSAGIFVSRWIEDFANTGDLATVATLPFTPEASVDKYWILPVRADVTGGSGLDAAGVRAAIGLASANLDTQLGDLPTNAELATSQAAADDATLAAIAALNNLSAAQVNSEVDTALADINLDHLVKIAVDTNFATTVHADSVVGQIADNGAGFDRTTDSLEAIRDVIGTPVNLGGGAATLGRNLQDIELQTEQIGASGAGLTALATAAELAKVPKSDGTATWNATARATLESEANDALVVHRLDELMNADSDIDGAAPPTVGSVFHELMTKTAGSFTYDQTTDSQEAIRDNIGTNGGALSLAKTTNITGFNDVSAAQVNAEVVDGLNVDTYGETSGVPGATASIVTKLSRLYDALINKLDVTSGKKKLYNNSDVQQWEKDLSDDGTTYSETKGNAP